MKTGKNSGTWFFNFEEEIISVVLGSCVKRFKKSFTQNEMKIIMSKLEKKDYKFFIPFSNNAIGMFFTEIM